MQISDIAGNEDAFFDERKKRLHTLYEDIKSGNEPMYDFDASTNELLEELQT